ncbi:hypothetical protein GcM3_052025 [Golovinomyces cichoracearum]|uniref:Uncharacterized protein n=1 Tax=Golovinomyces cichoracearum TaxID=62708 RepID=A0A420IZ58_9PEZI|nr:hypothetical protein GcM3_052025 [Golovinomyces cichoracearum]
MAKIFEYRTSFEFTAILQILENLLPYAIKAIWAHWWLSKTSDVGLITTVGRFDAFKIALCNLTDKKYTGSAIAFLYLTTLLPVGFLATIYEKGDMRGHGRTYVKEMTCNTSTFQEARVRYLTSETLRVGGGAKDYVNRMYKHETDEVLEPKIQRGYLATNLTLPDSAMRDISNDKSKFSFKLSPGNTLINMQDFYSNVTSFLGLDVEIREGEYYWIPGRTQVSFSMDRMYRTEMGLIPVANRANSGVGDYLTVVSSHHVSVIAKTASNCNETSKGAGDGLVKIAPTSWAVNYVFCKSYDLEGHKHNYEIQVNVSIKYRIEKDNYPFNYGFLTFVMIDQFNSSNVGETLSTGQANITSLKDLPKYFITGGGPFATVSTNVEVFRKQEGIRYVVIMPWLAALMAIYGIGMTVSITGTYSAGASIAELIYRSEVMNNSDCMGNKLKWWERLTLPPSHLRSRIKYMKSGSAEKEDLHVTVVMDDMRLMAVPSDVAGDVLLKARSLTDINRKEFAEVAKSASASRPNDFTCVSADDKEPYLCYECCRSRDPTGAVVARFD